MRKDQWPEVKLGDHVDLLSGFAFKSKNFTDNPDDIPLVKGANVHQGYIDWAGAVRWPKDDFDTLEKFHLKENDVVLAMDRPWIEVGLKYSWIKKGDPKSMLVQRVSRLRGVNGLNTRYLRYVIGSPQFTGYIKPIVTGVNVPHISGAQIKGYKFHLPPEEHQNNIADILESYDNLIENNNRRIAILEEMARSLYREWFVKFRFPGHENAKFIDSPLGKIPEGWEVVTVEELVKRYQTGKKYNNKTALSEGEVPILDQGKSGVIGYHNDEPGVVATEDDPIIVFANHTCYQKIIHYPFSAIQNVLPFKSIGGERERDLYWLHFATKDVIEFNDYKGHWPEFMAKKIVLATREVCSSFGMLVKPIERQKYKLECQVALLKKQRDLILPKLISASIQI